MILYVMMETAAPDGYKVLRNFFKWAVARQQ